MYIHFKCASKAFSGWHLCRGGGRRGKVYRSVSRRYFLAAESRPARTPCTPPIGEPASPLNPPKGGGGLPPIGWGIYHEPRTRRRSHLREPRRPRLSSPAPLSLATQLLGLLGLTARLWFSSVLFYPFAQSKPGSATRRPHSSPTSGARSAASAPPRASPEGTASCRHHGELRRRPKGPTPGWVLPGGGNSAFLALCQSGAESGVTPFPSWVHHRQGLREEVEAAQRGGGGAACQRVWQWVEALRARCPTRCLPTTCRVAAFTPPCLPPAVAGWVVRGALGVGLWDSVGGGGHRAPAPPPPCRPPFPRLPCGG